jgi:polyisoprenoid-binding protein YceI
MSETTSPVARYKLNAAQSKFTVQAFATGLLAGFGHNPTVAIRDFSGEARLVPDKLTDASLQLRINVKSLDLLDEVKEKDRQEIERTMLNDVLEVHQYPEIIFQSKEITLTRIIPGRYRAKIIGEVTMHGVTRQAIWVMAQLTLNGDDLRAQGDFALRQTDFNIKLVSVAAGALKLKDEVKFTFDLVGHKE